MHECPNCGQACDCDNDDLWDQTAASFCVCECMADDLGSDGCDICGGYDCDCDSVDDDEVLS
jgi:hypothetical protein